MSKKETTYKNNYKRQCVTICLSNTYQNTPNLFNIPSHLERAMYPRTHSDFDYSSDSPSSLSKALINPSIREGMRSPKSFNALPAS